MAKGVYYTNMTVMLLVYELAQVFFFKSLCWATRPKYHMTIYFRDTKRRSSTNAQVKPFSGTDATRQGWI